MMRVTQKKTKDDDAKGENEEMAKKKELYHSKKIYKQHKVGRLDRSKLNAVTEDCMCKGYSECED